VLLIQETKNVAFSINTNIASLQAQEYLRMTGDFQSKTISRVTSGLRIVNAGDDAAGLAIANSFRSDQAVLSQGIRNANDGLATLQTIDGGITNIGKLLDRARTLATQSASGTFNGSRSVLDSEFTSLMTEIDRQAQAIGLNQNGLFAKSLSVFIGGGRASGGVTAIDNGAVSVDLTTSTVDAQSLGLKGVRAANTGYDLGTGAGRVESVVADTTNANSVATPGYTTFRFFGAGFGDSSGVSIAVNTAGMADTDTLVDAVNDAIAAAELGSTSQAQAFKAAGITASIVTDANGDKQLAFSSSSQSFQVAGGDRMANALLGNRTGATGDAIANTVAGANGAGGTFGASTSITVRFEGGGLASPVELTLDTSSTAADDVAVALQAAIAADSSLQAAGITQTSTTAASGLDFQSARGEKFMVSVSGDTNNRLGLGGFFLGGVGNDEFEYNTISLGTETEANATNTRFTFSLNGADGIDVNVAWTTANIASDALMQGAINDAIAAQTSLNGSGITASVAAGVITFTAGAGTNFRLQVSGDAASADYGSGLTTLTSYTAPTVSGADFKAYVSQGAYQIGAAGTAAPLAFSAINYATDTQAITVSGVDSNGTTHAENISLTNTNARSIDEAIHTINAALQQTNDTTLQKITAIKVNDGGAEKIQFVSSVPSFQVAIGTNANGTGISQASTLVQSTQVGEGATASIADQASAERAVTALADAVSALGDAQAVVGKGQNTFNFAVSLASTQLVNLAASESRIRDADLALEAANLTKAQLLQQAGIAALAQANSAPQAVLSLLRG
jgi:flagellin